LICAGRIGSGIGAELGSMCYGTNWRDGSFWH
jgi:hypothetical protein